MAPDPESGGKPLPAAPWQLRGPAVVVVGLIPLAVARSRVSPAARLLPMVPGYAATCLVLARYEQASTLRYAELAAMIGPAVTARGGGGWVQTMLVDDADSLEGGRRIWNVPKQPATFRWVGSPPNSVAVDAPGGECVVSARWSWPARTLPLPVWAPFLGGFDRSVVLGRLTGVMRAAPVQVSIEIPSGSPLVGLGLGGTRRGLVGLVDVRARSGRGVGHGPRRS